MEMDLFEKALVFAMEKHHGAKRKASDIPFILHPMEVAVIASTMSEDEVLLAAALLHDTVEDTDATLEEIRENFGDEVLALVASETEDKRPGTPPSETWLIRKQESLRELETAEDINVKKLWLADKLANMRSFHAQYAEKGRDMWNVFHQKDPKLQEWYYREIVRLTEELKDYPAWQEYSFLVNTIFKGDNEQ